MEFEGEVPGGSPIEIVTTEEIEDVLAAGNELPAALPVLPLRDMVTYPGTLTPLAVGQERSIRLIDDVLSGDRALVMVASKDPELDEPGPGDIERVGVAGAGHAQCHQERQSQRAPAIQLAAEFDRVARLAAARKTPSERTDALWSSIEHYVHGHEFKTALEELNDLLADPPVALAPVALVRRGEVEPALAD